MPQPGVQPITATPPRCAIT